MKRLFLATLLVVMMGATTALAATWQQIYTDGDENKVLFDTSSVKVAVHNDTNSTFSATFCVQYSDQGRKSLIEWYRHNSIVPHGIENVAYEIETINFRKSGDMRDYYVITRTAYTAGGAVIEDMQFNNPNPTWQTIPVGSLLDVEYYEAFLIVDGKRYKRIDSSDL